MLTIYSGDEVVYNTVSAQVETDVCKHFHEWESVDVSADDLYKCALKLRSLHGFHLFEDAMEELMPFFEWCELCYGLQVKRSYGLKKDFMNDKDWTIEITEEDDN